MNMKSDNGRLFKNATILVSTVSLPQIPGMRLAAYETCIFSGKESEAVETYETLSEAVSGHVKHALKLGATRKL